MDIPIETEIPLEFDPEVEEAIAELLPSDDPLQSKDFSPVEYINQLFPTEQSLSSIDDVVGRMNQRIHELDIDIRSLIKEQTTAASDGREALDTAKESITNLFNKIKDIRVKAEQSEVTVKEITRDIKQLDHAKRNLTISITTLNHLHMLVGGVDSLGTLTKHRQYSEAASLLQGVMYVMHHFKPYLHIPQIKELSERLEKQKRDLAAQIRADFEEAHSLYDCKLNCQPDLAEGCQVMDALEPRNKIDLVNWFLDRQLSDYKSLFREYDEVSWLDKCDRRYAWLKRCFMEYEEECSRIFPPNWNMLARIAHEFCKVTRKMLEKQMKNRTPDLDVKLLLFAIQKTQNFEKLLTERFEDPEHPCYVAPATTETTDGNNEQAEAAFKVAFTNSISQCFEQYLHIYIESQDQNLRDLIEKFVNELKEGGLPQYQMGDPAPLLPSSSDLFVFYKKCLVQCSQLSRGQALVDLTSVFKTHLRSYHSSLLLPTLPNRSSQSSGFSSLLKDKDDSKTGYTDAILICTILCTAEYCLDTIQQLEDKIKEKTDEVYGDKISFTAESELYSNTITNCLFSLVQSLDGLCEPALNAMLKVNWATLDSVGDQSAYTTAITSHLQSTCPVVRDLLQNSRKYFTNYCLKFVNSFIPRYVTQIYKCRPISTVGAEQLLLDTHSLKTVLLQLPNLNSAVQRKAPPSFIKAVSQGMSKAEMILKLVMAPSESAQAFVESYTNLISDYDVTEFQKLLEMKGVRRGEQQELIEILRKTANITTTETEEGSAAVQDSSRIRKLEKLIKKGF